MRKKTDVKQPPVFRILFFAFIFLLSIVPSLFSGSVELDNLSDVIFVSPHVEYLEDEKGDLTIEDVRSKQYNKHWIPSDKKSLGFGYTSSVYWIRFVIQNRRNFDIEYFLENSFPTVDDIKLYIYNNGNSRVIETGDLRPFSQRSYKYRNYVFPLKSKAKSSSVFYMRQASFDSMVIKLKVWSPEVFREMANAEYRILIMFYGIILIMSLYNFIIFTFTRRIEYLYYVLFNISFLLLMMTVNGTAVEFLWPESPGWANYSLPLFNVLLQIFLGLFCMELVELRTKREGIPYRQVMFKTIIILITIPAITFIVMIVLSYPHPTAITVFYTGVVIVHVIIIGIILIIKERNRSAIFGLFAASAILIGGIAVILVAFGVLPAIFVFQWPIYLGSVIMVALFSYALADRINTMTKVIIKAEKKYRELVESSDDIIFSLDKNLNFLSVNKAIRKHLGYYEENIVGKCFMDLIHESGDVSTNITRDVIEAYIDNLKKTKERISFKTDFKKRHTHEPVELSVKFEYAESDDRTEKIFGKASPLTDDTILKYIKLEKNIFEAENYLNNVEILSQRLTRSLSRFLEKSEILRVRLSLREVLVNAIEHGNLDINFDEKTNAMFKGHYLKYILERQGDPRYQGRKIHIDYLLTEDCVTYTIADEGKGFDYENLADLISQRLSETLLPHGRGLIMVREIFDSMEFNEKGNQVTLVKYFNK